MQYTTDTPAVPQPPLAYDEITKRPVMDRGPWLATSRGGMWSVMTPHPRDVFLDDLVWGIARQCRYGGQIKPGLEVYSVAEHSTEMTWWALNADRIEYLEDALVILLHDTSEAFYGDIATPIKAFLPEYRVIEDRGLAVIMDAFGLTPDNTLIKKAELKEIDKRIRVDERRQLIAEPALTKGLEISWESDPDLTPLGVKIECLLPSQARENFLCCFTWCFENLPARDPSIMAKLKAQLEGIGETFPARRPEPYQFCEVDFEPT